VDKEERGEKKKDVKSIKSVALWSSDQAFRDQDLLGAVHQRWKREGREKGKEGEEGGVAAAFRSCSPLAKRCDWPFVFGHAQ